MKVSPFFRVVGLALIVAAMIATSRRQVVRPAQNWRAQFTAAALKIPFDSERALVLDDGVPKDARPDAPKMTIASALTRDTGQVGRLESRITSDTAYPRLGIAPGVNYVWRDVVNGSMRQLVIPADTAYRAHWLTVARHNHAAPRNAPRLLVVRDSARSSTPAGKSAAVNTMLVIAKCEPCDLGWCISRDTTPSTAAARLKYPVNEFARFFARNKVPWSK